MILNIFILALYIHANDDKACCIGGIYDYDYGIADFHERCIYRRPISDCKNFCDKDPNCKGYFVDTGPGECNVATTSKCDQSPGGMKFNLGNTGDLNGSCGHAYGRYGGCYVKQLTSKKPYFSRDSHFKILK